MMTLDKTVMLYFLLSKKKNWLTLTMANLTILKQELQDRKQYIEWKTPIGLK